MQGVGVQVRTKYANGSSSSRFIDCARISEIIINEGFYLMQVKFYLAVIVENEDQLVVVFEASWRISLAHIMCRILSVR